ncbi:MAG: 5-oxoprolinase subunit PxpB [Gammaproteobacteria bacterium]|nr:5-oxoprolinase subunit PxpB [Gammaproteobacteria bacterium]MBU2678025.1 5-oxoprolinase subunit PxpB [Gammaproteobacteria bacterium]NNC55999.1 5-oxoprolinase subunit PxpB [Woeseiaceae bacterium]NNL51760.1 5-oxoprolinase subunit PxpB [Woeseiaceae bacterium]
MSLANKIQSCGDDLLSVAVPGPAESQQLAARLRATGEWLEVVGGIDTVALRFDAANIDADAAQRTAHESIGAGIPVVQSSPVVVEIPVCYGGEYGPDFDAVCSMLDLSAEELVALHTEREYTVDMLGFTPGFAYIGGLDKRLNVARLREPRVQVAAGSVGIAAGRTGLYALPGPGGWVLIGRTSHPLFDATADEPFALSPGTRVRFVAVSAL